MPSYAFPPPPPSMEPTPLAELDRIVERLAERKSAWARLSVDARVKLLDTLSQRGLDIAEEWTTAANLAKGMGEGDPVSGEEWLAGPVVTLRNVRLLRQSLEQVRDHGAPVVTANQISTRSDSRVVVQVFPNDLSDSLLFSGFTAEVWMQRGVTAETLSDHMARAYREPEPEGKVALVLGAGNVASIPPMDALYKLFVDNEVVILKMNPVNEYLGPLLRKMFQPMVDEGFLEVVYGGADVGAHLVKHPKVDTVHMTGSDATHDAIVWGPREGRSERKASGDLQFHKPITAELGNVTPVIVVPGKWSDKELQFQAENVATMVVNNASFNCTAAKLLVTPRDWDQRDDFLARLKAVLAATPNRKAYYPGARNRWQAFLDAHPEAETLTEDNDETVPWTFIDGLDPKADEEICFTTEPFCGVLHDVALPGKTAVDFLPGAVEFCNERVWGTLACQILIDPATRREPGSEQALQEALDELRYGSIAVNHWAGLIYGFVTTTWGAFPGHSAEDIQSGRGVVHNSYLFDKPEKSVLYGPFTVFPKPPWFITHGRMLQVGRAMTGFEANPSLLKVPGIAFHALLG